MAGVKPFEPDPLIRWRKGALWLAVLVLASLLAYAGFRAYRKFEQARMVGIARTAIEEGRPADAGLPLQRVLRLNPLNLDANRIMGDLAESWKTPSAVFWRIRTADLSNGETSDLLALAGTALRINRIPMAVETLERVPESERNTVAYHRLATEAALRTGNTAWGEENYAAWETLEPGSPEIAVGLAGIGLRSPQDERAGEARRQLMTLRTDEKHGAQALRLLLTDVRTTLSPPELMELALDLHTHPASNLTDQLVALEVLGQGRSPAFRSALESVKQDVSVHPDLLMQLIGWMLRAGMNEDALACARSNPAASEFPASTMFARALVAAGQWAELLELCESTDWQTFDFLRNAFIARARRELGDDPLARARLNRAIATAASHTASAAELADLLASWGWDAEQVTLLWRVASDSPARSWALGELFHFYAQRGDTENLLRVSRERLKSDPEDRIAENNRIMFLLLTGAEPAPLVEDAKQLVESDVENPVFASTLAFALHRAGRTGEALEIMESLDPLLLDVPQFAAYHGIYLEASGRHDEAVPALELGRSLPLLPEELALLSQALGRIQSPD